MKRIALVVLIMLSMVGCTQKFPTNTAENTGLIVVPMKARSDLGSYYFYYYKIHSDEPNSAVIPIYPAPGVDFVFSEPLPPGDYWFSQMDVIANLSERTSTPTNKSTRHISFPVKVEAGKANLLSRIFEVSVNSIDNNSYSCRHIFRDMDDEEEQLYLEKLKAMDEKNEWEIF